MTNAYARKDSSITQRDSFGQDPWSAVAASKRRASSQDSTVDIIFIRSRVIVTRYKNSSRGKLDVSCIRWECDCCFVDERVAGREAKVSTPQVVVVVNSEVASITC